MLVDPEKVHQLLEEQRDQAPEDLQHLFIKFEDYWERKLWHELTDALIEFYDRPESKPQRILLYDDFIKIFSDKINQLKLTRLGLSAATQCKDERTRLSFVNALAKKTDKPASQDAFVYATVALAEIKLKLGDIANARADLDRCESILDMFDSVEMVVHAAFYRTNGDYYKAKQEFTSYYKNALLYLACIPLSAISTGERRSRAHDLSIAALLSDSIYNYGELLLHPILTSLVDTPHAWLRDLLFAYNRGDLDAYYKLVGNLSKNELLNRHAVFLYQKISLSALTEMVFRRPPHNRAMSFPTIADETKVKANEIEHLIMKALSLGLLRGTIDQVAQVVNINWVQPKVLDMSQIENMRSRLTDWDSNVNQLGTWIEGVGKEVWAT